MTKSEPMQITTKLKQRQKRASYEAAIRLQEQLNEEEKIEWEDIRASVEANEELTQKLQAEERDKYSEVDQARMLVDMINQRKRYFAAQKAKAKRNKPINRRLEVDHGFIPLCFSFLYNKISLSLINQIYKHPCLINFTILIPFLCL
ncbi:hypothetical protein Tco_0255573 [Tanacetum coccineum]